MRYAADLHLHSRYASGVSPQMTVENLALWARYKGMDVMSAGDCLQPQWFAELEEKLVPAEPGWFALAPGIENSILQALPPLLRQPLRFVLGTEICCAPPGTGRLGGIHHLVYFPSLESALRFRERIGRYGDLSEGRPEVRLTSSQLLQLVRAHGADCHFAPAHVMNPYFSTLGSREGHKTLAEVFGDGTAHLLAVETGLTSTPPMCRRLSSLDGHALFSCSDAHSPDNLGRECTVLETEAGYEPMFAALGRGEIFGTFKYPISLTRYYLNRCGRCQESFAEAKCPKCGGPLATGSRDWLEQMADRPEPVFPAGSPPFQMLLPLKRLLASLLGVGWKSKRVGGLYDSLLSRVGHERFILTEADHETLVSCSSLPIAEAILAQREADPAKLAELAPESQMSLSLE